jgi:hypothetical protein
MVFFVVDLNNGARRGFLQQKSTKLRILSETPGYGWTRRYFK